MKATIRPATPADLPALTDLYHQLHPDEPPWPSEAAAAEVLSEVLAHPGTTIFVGTIDGRVVSTCVLIVTPNFSRCGRPFAMIENVVTNNEHRQRGYGRQTVQHAIERARAEGCYRVTLMTSSKREATLRFYDGAGMRRNSKTTFEARFI
jgi:ribosomal protein S18 acetylase RimI-like enzyme